MAAAGGVRGGVDVQQGREEPWGKLGVEACGTSFLTDGRP